VPIVGSLPASGKAVRPEQYKRQYFRTAVIHDAADHSDVYMAMDSFPGKTAKCPRPGLELMKTDDLPTKAQIEETEVYRFFMTTRRAAQTEPAVTTGAGPSDRHAITRPESWYLSTGFQRRGRGALSGFTKWRGDRYRWAVSGASTTGKSGVRISTDRALRYLVDISYAARFARVGFDASRITWSTLAALRRVPGAVHAGSRRRTSF